MRRQLACWLVTLFLGTPKQILPFFIEAGHRVVAVLPRLGLFTIAVEFAIVVSSIVK